MSPLQLSSLNQRGRLLGRLSNKSKEWSKEMRMRSLLTLLALAMSLTSLAAQGTTGQLAGRIVDAQGLPVPGATVTVTGPQGAKTSVAGADGRFIVPFL